MRQNEILEGFIYPNEIKSFSTLMQIQETTEIGSTKRKFHLSRVSLIESIMYI